MLRDRLLDRLASLVEPQLGGLEDRLVGHAVYRVRCRQFFDPDAIERPAVRLGDGRQFRRGLGQAYINASFAGRDTGAQELQRGGRLARARRTLHDVEIGGRKAPSKNLVQSGDARRDLLLYLTLTHAPLLTTDGWH